MSFKNYESRPTVRKAYQIKDGDSYQRVSENTYAIHIDGDKYTFKAFQPIKQGDYVVYLNQNDIYHCSQEVFKERNIVQ